jgi:large subunit ribosomal protein L35
MPKLKTHKGTAKRFRVTKKGRVKRWHSGRRHLMLNKTRKRLRKLRKGVMCAPMDAHRVRELLCLE